LQTGLQSLHETLRRAAEIAEMRKTLILCGFGLMPSPAAM